MVLRPFVEKYGEVKDMSLPRDHDTGKLRGFGSITYADAKSLKGAIKNLDGSE
jgi:RNA recognition motif-containing protein